MDKATATYLSELNRRFYAENAASFSSTRHASWPGWEHLASMIPDGQGTLSVLDVACGNMRFADFLEHALSGRDIDYHGIDSCDDLVPAARRGGFVHRDIVGELLGPDGPAAQPAPHPLAPGRFDLVVCFGFFHHVPGAENRKRLLRALLASARPGGLVAASFWRFLSDGRLSAKARVATERMLAGHPELASQLEPGDAFLGWQERADSFRYCHSFDEPELDALAAGVADLATPLARYRADGRSGELNEYLLFRSL